MNSMSFRRAGHFSHDVQGAVGYSPARLHRRCKHNGGVETIRFMRVLILTSSTGGGHNMRARAFQEWSQMKPDNGLSVQLHRPLEKSHEIYAFGVWLYNWIQRTAPFLHQVYFNFLEVVPVVRTRKPLAADRYRQGLVEMPPQRPITAHDSLKHRLIARARQ